MPSFTSTVPNLRGFGPLVKVRLTVGMSAEAAFRSRSILLPPPLEIDAMIDTGATGTVIREGLAGQLGLKPVGVANISTPSSVNVQCYEYLVRLLFPNNVQIETKAIEAPLQGQHIQCLIGRDVLAHGVLVYIGYANLFSLSF